MKPGDLVEIIDYGGYYSTDPPWVGVILGWPGTNRQFVEVLADGKVQRFTLHELRPLVNPEDGGYDNMKENT